MFFRAAPSPRLHRVVTTVHWVGASLFAALFVVVVLIVQAKSKSEAQRVANEAAEQAVIEQAATDGKPECYAILAGSGSMDKAVDSSNRYPCNRVPTGSEEPYWIVIAIKGVPSEATTNTV